MVFRKATKKDLREIMAIIHQAQEDLKCQGVDQWQDGYPNEEIVLADIQRQENYVLEEEGTIIATVVLSFHPEPSYERIYGGAWKKKDPYAVIHRIAVARCKKKTGAAKKILEEMIEICRQMEVFSIRIDTHQDNKVMQSWMLNNQFEYCGVIYLKSSGAPRNAYERGV